MRRQASAPAAKDANPNAAWRRPSGTGQARRRAPVITPRVPSEPTKSWVRSGPRGRGGGGRPGGGARVTPRGAPPKRRRGGGGGGRGAGGGSPRVGTTVPSASTTSGPATGSSPLP